MGLSHGVCTAEVHASLSWRQAANANLWMVGSPQNRHRRYSGSSNGRPLNASNGQSSGGDIPSPTNEDRDEVSGAQLNGKVANNGTAPSIIMSIPTALTVLRLLAIPPVVWLFQFSDPVSALWTASIFVAASFTDWLDGFLARKLVRRLSVTLSRARPYTETGTDIQQSGCRV